MQLQFTGFHGILLLTRSEHSTHIDREPIEYVSEIAINKREKEGEREQTEGLNRDRPVTLVRHTNDASKL